MGAVDAVPIGLFNKLALESASGLSDVSSSWLEERKRAYALQRALLHSFHDKSADSGPVTAAGYDRGAS